MSEERQLTQFDELAARHNAAFVAFRSIHELKHPPPEMPEVERDSIFIPLALVVMIVASVLVSGSRTIFEFGGGLVGVAAFVMLEGAIVAYAFYRTRRSFNENRLESVRKLANFGLGLAFAVAVGANVHAVLRESRVQLAGWINTAILISVGISAPTLAFISGDIMAVETMANTTKSRKAKAEYQKEVAAWAEGLNTAWSREKSKWGVRIEVERPADRQTDKRLLSDASVLSVSEQTDSGQTNRSGFGHNRTADGQSKVIEYLMLNPDHAKLPSRELAKLIGVGHDTANKGRNAWRDQEVNNQS